MHFSNFLYCKRLQCAALPTANTLNVEVVLCGPGPTTSFHVIAKMKLCLRLSNALEITYFILQTVKFKFGLILIDLIDPFNCKLLSYHKHSTKQ